MSETIDNEGGREARRFAVGPDTGAELFRQACATGLEGVVAKRAGSPYRGKRSENWIKVRC